MTEIKPQPDVLEIKCVAGDVPTTEQHSPDFRKDKIIFARRFWNAVYIRTEGAGAAPKSILFHCEPPLTDDLFNQLVGSEINLG